MCSMQAAHIDFCKGEQCTDYDCRGGERLLINLNENFLRMKLELMFIFFCLFVDICMNIAASYYLFIPHSSLMSLLVVNTTMDIDLPHYLL